MKTFVVPMEGRVFHAILIKANSPEEAIEKAYTNIDDVNLKEKIYTYFDYDTTVEMVEEATAEEFDIGVKRTLQ